MNPVCAATIKISASASIVAHTKPSPSASGQPSTTRSARIAFNSLSSCGCTPMNRKFSSNPADRIASENPMYAMVRLPVSTRGSRM